MCFGTKSLQSLAIRVVIRKKIPKISGFVQDLHIIYIINVFINVGALCTLATLVSLQIVKQITIKFIYDIYKSGISSIQNKNK